MSALGSLPLAAPGTPALPCRLPGVTHDALCGSVLRALDPQQPQGRQISVHYAVLPAVARNKLPDPVFFFAGGPGQSAIDLAGALGRVFVRFGNRRDIVLIDQRGTGRSAPLHCDEHDASLPLRDVVDPQQQAARLLACRSTLTSLPHGDLSQYTTSIAVQDVDAVRRMLGVERFNAIGGSYGTRAVLEVMRQFPLQVRRAVIDGVAPADMVLPLSFSTDAQAAFDALLAACALDAICRTRHPALRAQWQTLLASLPREVTVAHPLSGRTERFTLTREMVLSLVRLPLYVPSLASALPLAISEAAAGRPAALVGLSAAGAGPTGERALAQGMHFSVVCAEDWPRMGQSTDIPGADFAAGLADIYRLACADWPRGVVPAAFYTLPPAPSATLVLSGGIDPVTPPRHGQRVAVALGAKARHVVVANAGHGVLSIGCMRDVLFRFVDAATDALALAVDAECAAAIPRPPVFVPPLPNAAASGVAP